MNCETIYLGHRTMINMVWIKYMPVDHWDDKKVLIMKNTVGWMVTIDCGKQQILAWLLKFWFLKTQFGCYTSDHGGIGVDLNHEFS